MTSAQRNNDEKVNNLKNGTKWNLIIIVIIIMTIMIVIEKEKH